MAILSRFSKYSGYPRSVRTLRKKVVSLFALTMLLAGCAPYATLGNATDSLASSGAGGTSGGSGGGATTPADPADGSRTVLKVCASGCTYILPSQAVAAAKDTDIIEVQAGTYNDCFTLTKNGIKLRGIGGRAHLSGKACGGKGAIVTMGSDTVIENFEFSNISVPDGNGAGVRHQGLGLIIRNSYFHDGEDGILSGGQTYGDARDTVVVENSRFERLGLNGQAHGSYFGPHTMLTVRNSIFVSSKSQGHEFKSRAANALIECSFMGSLDGVDSYSLNFPDAGNVTVRNSVIEQGSSTSNSGIVDYGSEMLTRHPVNVLKFDGVAFINDLDRGTFFNVRNSSQFAVANSVVVGAGSLYSLQTATETAVTRFASRAAAGFAAYPAFPKPAACADTIGLLF